MNAVINTLLIEPDKLRFIMTWCVYYPLRRNCFELKQAIAVDKPKAWYKDRQLGGKPYYKNLEELAKARKFK